MPLPDANIKWPPSDLGAQRAKMDEWDAWYTGDPDRLSRVYGGGSGSGLPGPTAGIINRPSQYRGGLQGALARMMWGRPIPDGQGDHRVHIPLAADLAQASADLLYSEAPALTLGDDKDKDTKDRLELYADDGFVDTLAAGAELGAALGGRYQRVSWDVDVHPDRPFLSTVDADAAAPEFRYGRLVAVTFHWILTREGGTVWRHLERHEQVKGVGVVIHGLYEGTGDYLGTRKDLRDHPVTAPLAEHVDQAGYVKVGHTPGLCVEYVPNLTPNRLWRNHPVGRSLGRSDFDGVEPLFDALDEAYSSWMRDIRVAKAKLLIPEYMTQTRGHGQGVTFDLDREAYVTVNSAADEDGDAAITPMQFAIRVEEHRATTQDIIENILRSAGYSSATFGEDEDGSAATATETNARKGRSLLTRSRKVRLERPALTRLVQKMLAIDVDVFKTVGIDPAAEVTVDFGAGHQDSPLQLAQTVQAIEAAKAASVETKIRMLHPDWEDQQVEDEAKLVRDDYSMGAVASPDANPFTGAPSGPAGAEDETPGPDTDTE